MKEETLFAEALGKKGEARAAFLDEHCKDDVELRRIKALQQTLVDLFDRGLFFF